MKVTSGGSGYTTATISFTGGGTSPQGAAAVAVITGDVITTIRVTDPGAHYTEIPTVVINGDGAGAAATAVVDGRALIENTTDVDLYDGSCADNGTGLPVAVPVACGDNGLTGGYPTSRINTSNDQEYNAYTTSSTKFADYASCSFIGRKAVQAIRCWHGMYGYDLNYLEGVDTPWRYTSVTSQFDYEIGPPTGNYNIKGSASVNQNSGKITYSGFELDSSTPATAYLFGAYSTLEEMAGWFFAVRQNADASELALPQGLLASAEQTNVNAVLNSGTPWDYVYDPLTRYVLTRDGTLTWDDNAVEFTLIAEQYTRESSEDPWPESPEATATGHVKIDLGGKWTKADFLDSAYALLDEWDLTNDKVYPWRNDIYDTVNPVVIYDDIGEDGGGRALIPSAVELAGGLMSDCSGMCNTTGTPPTCDDCRSGSGGIIGSPLPVGTEKHFQFDHRNYSGASVASRGDWNKPATSEGIEGIPACAPRWTDTLEDIWTNGAVMYYDGGNCVLYMQKWAEILQPRPSVNFFRLCGEDRYAAVTDAQDDSGTILLTLSVIIPWIAIDDVVRLEGVGDMTDGDYTITDVVQSTSTLIKVPLRGGEALNWMGGGSIYGPGWPICGRVAVESATQNGSYVDIVLSTAAAYLRTGEFVDFTDVGSLGTNLEVTVTDSTHFSVTGTVGTYAGGGYVSSHGAPAYYWNDSDRKGDFVTMETYYDDNDSIITDGQTCSNQKKQFSPCHPSVACFSPNAETQDAWHTFSFPSSFVLNTSNAEQLRWVGKIFGTTLDPFVRDGDNPTENDYVEALVDDPDDNYPKFATGLGAGTGQDESPTHFTNKMPCPPLSDAVGEDSGWEEWSA